MTRKAPSNGGHHFCTLFQKKNMRKKEKSMGKKRRIKNLVDIRTVKVDQSLPKQERIREFVRQIKDPFHFRHGKYKVTLRFNQDGPTLEDYLIKIKLEEEAERIMGDYIK